MCAEKLPIISKPLLDRYIFSNTFEEKSIGYVIKSCGIYKSQVDLIPEIIITVICRIEGVDSSEILGHLDKKTLDIIDNSLKYVQFDEVINF